MAPTVKPPSSAASGLCHGTRMCTRLVERFSDGRPTATA